MSIKGSVVSKETEPQTALKRGPGRFRALLTFEPPTPNDGCLAAAELLAELESEKLNGGGRGAQRIAARPLKVLVAVSPAILENHPHFKQIQAELGDRRPYANQAKVLVQVAAETEDERTYALCLIERIFGARSLEVRQQFYGGRHLLSREAFGYRDTSLGGQYNVPVSANVLGTSWLLFQQCDQDMQKFYSLSPEAQNRVMGRKRDPMPGEINENFDEHSHAVAARHASGQPSRLLRRSFSYREYGKAGLAFVAAAAHPEHLLTALEAFRKSDSMREHVTLGAGGLYLVPPSSRWLVPAVDFPVRKFPVAHNEAPAPEDGFYPNNPLFLYELTPASLSFFHKVFHDNSMNFDERGDLRPDLLLLARGMAKLLWGARIPEDSKLFKLLKLAFATDLSERALPELAKASPITEAVMALAKLRGHYEKDRHTAEQKRSLGNGPAAATANMELNAHLDNIAQQFKTHAREHENVVRAALAHQTRISKLLGDDTTLHGQNLIEEILSDLVVEDAQAIHPQSGKRKTDLETIDEDCRRGAAEARALNQFCGEYTTFSC
jgi:hypothetical protein